ncbi:glycine zipper 2TM domain-containing protein [Pseudoxanthomonas sp. CF125]|uniref:glycine zipper 2TM domain-containing protein n=1 Tax=Pseudoxanthomonas sp. CF125 TaxID=1855303 RepID=UPI0008871C94|nr:glycine zipper 2TM domain-containing protein [Pseudoxanthomonas sp. CF125]SDQ50792.1 Glycine zipper 2TM domain-containing protein [Pseudoxanthomonas sp. CF125]
MKRLSAGLLVAGFAFTGTAFAQSSGYYGQDDRYDGSDPYTSDSYQGQGATYDYARVLRVDPVIGSGYRNRTSQQSSQCYYRQADDVYTGNDGYYNRDDRYDRDNGYYGRDDGYRGNGNETSRTVATVIGGIAGAVLGSKVGDGSGRYVGTAVGSMVGGMAGRSIYDSSQRNRQYQRRGTVRVCDPVPVTSRDGYYGDGYGDDESLNGYDVTYEYANRTYHTRTNYHPGDRIRVRVDVQAE